ncbi:PQQ-binding-like beta-propeller repeat protein [Streptomyces sp. NPDC021356]|uniref:PQQ-binding-like beta-propeller repeat protein n=1 Tax=Streptomyces sp. NPDC021356 TaxID=3154900 RepID=UPI0033E96155
MASSVANELGGTGRAGVYPAGTVPDGFRPWRFRDRWGLLKDTPVVSDGIVYFSALQGACFAVDALTGECRWRFTAPSGMCHAPAVMGGLAFVTDFRQGLWALDALSGQVRWHHRGYKHTMYALAHAGVVYTSDAGHPFKFIRGKGVLTASDAATGEVLWSVPKHDYGNRTIALAGGRIFHNGGEGELSAYDARSGKLLWRDADGGKQDFGSANAPCAVDGVVYASSGGGVYAFDTQGRQLWGCRTGGRVVEAVAVRGDSVYVSVERQGVYALDAANGEERWQLADADGGSALAISGSRGWLAAGQNRRYLCAVDLATGRRLWQRDLGHGGRGSTPFLWNGIAFLAAGGNSVIAVEAERGLMPSRLRPAKRFRRRRGA